MPSAADAWSDALAAWTIPDEIIAAAPEWPWTFPPRLFARATERILADPEPTPSRRRAAEALPDGGSVLDVGAGAGAGGLPLAPPAAFVTAVDESPDMLAEFAAGAERRGVAHAEVQGRWPDVAREVAPADVVVCHHVAYNVPDLAGFALALTGHARHRVVIEISADHPAGALNPLWKALHDLDRPTTPTAADALAVLREAGLDVESEEYERPSFYENDDPEVQAERVVFARRRLCVGPERDAEIAELLGSVAALPPRRLVTAWWPGAAR